jgi:hypothetical protein
MGGLGSGRRSGSGRGLAEACLSIDAGALQRAGCLESGWTGLWLWMKDGEQAGLISLRTGHDLLHFTYRVRFGGSEWEDVAETVSIVEVPCRYGGKRPYFRCPGVVSGVVCARRVAKLYCAGRFFLCRHCYRLAYASQSERALDRMLRRANTIRKRVGGEVGMASPFPARPRGMWRRTYERLRGQTARFEMRADEAFEFRAAKLARCKRSNRKRSFWG